MKVSVAAVVVTFNRKLLLRECLDALLGQQRPPERVYVIDNASTDGTYQALRDGGYLQASRIRYTRLEENTGGAGGFHAGMRQAHEDGHHWIWVMDDDAHPHPDALEHLMARAERDAAARALASVVRGIDGQPQWHHRGWLRLCGVTNRIVEPIAAAHLQGADGMTVSMASFVGLAVHREVVERIGLPRREFFIHNDDVEYCLRMQRARVGITLVTHSVLVHKDARQQESGGGYVNIPIDKLWLSYYSVRNLVWLRARHCSPLVGLLYGLKHLVRQAPGIVRHGDHKALRLRFNLCAVWDGLTGRFDNARPRRLLGRV